VDYLASLGSTGEGSRRSAIEHAFADIQKYEATLAHQLLTGLHAIPEVTLYGIPELSRLSERTATVGIRLGGKSPAQAASFLGARGICTWAGNFYALSLTERLGLEDHGGVLRIGLVHYNTAEEVDRLLSELATFVQKN
jgi:selenocysteine lyase/cysteine desulfurase